MTFSYAAEANYDSAVYIGRFQPFHLGHLALLRQALALAPKVVIVVGSAHQARTPKNPFTWQERAEMISQALLPAERERVCFVPVRDYYKEGRWVQAVTAGVAAQVPGARRIALVGHFKDASSYYLRSFPGWDLKDCERQCDIDATALRRVMFDTPGQPPAAIFAVLKDKVPDGTREFLAAWWSLPHSGRLAVDSAWLQDYWRKWTAPFYNAADALVVCQNKVLLIERGRGQGAGLLALPGGFMEKGQGFYETAVRELAEETNFGLYRGSLDSYLVGKEVFDHPDRSLRARIISVAYHFDLGSMRLPEVTAGDDARQGSARWVPIEDLPGLEERFFEDHFHILDHFLGLTT